MHTTGYADVTHSLVDSTLSKRVNKVSGYCSNCIWMVHIWHVTICELCMTMKNSALSSTAHSSSIVLVIGLLAAMPHGFSPWVQPYCICHHGFCHIWRQPYCQLEQPSCICSSLQTVNLSTHLTKSS